MRHAAFAIAAVLLSACTTAQVQRVSAAYEDAFVPIESIGRFDHWRQKASPDELLKDGHPFSLVELGRRFEVGAGVPKDRDCAAWWYNRAFLTPYDEAQSTYAGGMVISTGTLRRAGLPQARVAFKHLLKSGPVNELPLEEARRRCSAAAN